MKKGFTIIELLAVIGIIGVLIGIVSTAAGGAIKSMRTQKADACCKVVQQGLATYYAQKGRWPGSIGTKIKNGGITGGFVSGATDGSGDGNDPNMYELTGQEIDDMMQDLIEEAKKGNPMCDISGLFVSNNPGEKGSKAMGLDFWDAVHGTRQSRRRMKTSEMHFGYPSTKGGYFRRFRVIYSIPADEMTVSRQSLEGDDV